MTDPIIYDDAQRATRDILRAILPAYGVTIPVSTKRPLRNPVDTVLPTAIRVRSGTPTRDTPASATATVRLTVYAPDEGEAMRLGSIVEAVLLSEASSDTVRSFGAVSGPVPGTDSETGDPIALVIVNARLRPRHLRKD